MDMIDKNIIQKKAEELIARYQIPSVSITWYHGGVYETVTAGYKDVEKQMPADADTMYSIGSCTKSFTAAAIALLCDRGQLNLDDPVRRYVPEFEMYDSYVAEHLTIRDMLCHRCGLPRHELAWYSRLSEYSEAQMLDMLAYLKPNAPFRYTWQYQNVMYTLAGIVISRVSGLSWEEFVQENLIAPLEMGPISYDAPQFETFETRAQGYRFFEEPAPAGNRPVPNSTLYTMKPAGSISMSSVQLAKWDAFLLNKGMAGGKRILSEEMCSQLFTPQMLVSDPIIEPLKGYLNLSTYGLGFFVENYRGVQIAQHGGHIDGFIADQCFVPDKDFACTVLTNSEHPFGARVMRYILLDAFLDLEEVDWIDRFYTHRQNLLQAQADARTDEDTIRSLSAAYPCPVDLASICGTYVDGGYGEITIEQEDGGLRLQLGTLTLHGVHLRTQFFLFTEPHVLPGEELEAEVQYDRNGNVLAFLVAMEPTSDQKIRFVKKEAAL